MESLCDSGASCVNVGAVRPNPSLEPTRTGMALGPLPRAVHHLSSGPSAIPAVAAQRKR